MPTRAVGGQGRGHDDLSVRHGPRAQARAVVVRRGREEGVRFVRRAGAGNGPARARRDAIAGDGEGVHDDRPDACPKSCPPPTGRSIPKRSPISAFPRAMFDRAQPWFVATNLSLAAAAQARLRSGERPGKRADRRRARPKRRRSRGWRRPSSRSASSPTCPSRRRSSSSNSTLKELPKTAETMDEMVGAWSRGDPAKLGEYDERRDQGYARAREDVAVSTATRAGRSGSRRGWPSRARCSSRSARGIWRASRA